MYSRSRSKSRSRHEIPLNLDDNQLLPPISGRSLSRNNSMRSGSHSRVGSRRNSMNYVRDDSENNLSRSNSRTRPRRNSMVYAKEHSRSNSRSRYRSSHIETNFTITTPPSGVFSSEYDRVQGEACVEMMDDVTRVISIDHGFKGRCYTECIVGGRRLNDVYTLFNFRKNSYNDKDMDHFTSSLKAGRVFNIPINHKFPSGTSSKPLPSTCNRLGGTFADGSGEGSATIRYDVYIRVMYYSSYHDKERCFEYTSELRYQGDCYEYRCPNLSYSEEGEFLGKLKLLIPDEYTGGMVLNPIDQEHRRSRFMRKVFNENYRKENLRDLCKDITLELTLSTAECFNVNSIVSLEDIYLRISWFDTHFLEPEFFFNGKSTMLGFFEIERISIGLQRNVFIFCEDDKFREAYWTKIPVKTSLYDFNFEDSRDKPNFDIADFLYDHDKQAYFLTTSLRAVTGRNGSIDLTKALSNPVIGNIVLNDESGNVRRKTKGKYQKYFSNQTYLSVDIVVGNAQEKDFQEREFCLLADLNVATPFAFHTSSMFPNDVVTEGVEEELNIVY